MPTLLLLSLVFVVTAPVAVTMETVVGVAGQKVELPCRLEAANQKGVDVCWGRGRPSLFTCHDAVMHGAGDQVYYRRSHRYRLSASSSFLCITQTQASDAGFYHCRVQLPGLFNDETATVHLIILNPAAASFIFPPTAGRHDASSLSSDVPGAGNLNAPPTDASYGAAVAMETGSGVNTTEAQVAQVQSSVQQQNHLQVFVGNTLRLSFIIFIPALLLTAAYRVWRSEQRSHADRSPEVGSSSV